jgi:hypothetical protein
VTAGRNYSTVRLWGRTRRKTPRSPDDPVDPLEPKKATVAFNVHVDN